MQELFESSGTEGQSLDYAVLYSAYHAMEALGLIQRKSDSSGTLRFLTWLGIQGLRTKYRTVFTPPEEISEALNRTQLQTFIRELISALLASGVSKEEYKSLR